jgi:hypothetical protein
MNERLRDEGRKKESQRVRAHVKKKTKRKKKRETHQQKGEKSHNPVAWAMFRTGLSTV